ncbi:hypothetical protein NDU88_001562 [Pleurodeles waltl]|uniref:Uncharacterized protein n=1 Tax=Pleurodeles waltl TaxID=8319 RepID=A0AAV7P5V6_PLEWA|nr:hypothetical protein NDU88_001562 [Pleurodeles waltl]
MSLDPKADGLDWLAEKEKALRMAPETFPVHRAPDPCRGGPLQRTRKPAACLGNGGLAGGRSRIPRAQGGSARPAYQVQAHAPQHWKEVLRHHSTWPSRSPPPPFGGKKGRKIKTAIGEGQAIHPPPKKKSKQGVAGTYAACLPLSGYPATGAAARAPSINRHQWGSNTRKDTQKNTPLAVTDRRQYDIKRDNTRTNLPALSPLTPRIPTGGQSHSGAPSRSLTTQAGTAIPGGKPNHKFTGKPERQLLFSEALQHKRSTSTTTGPYSSLSRAQPTTMSDKEQSTTMERILQEITAVCHRIEGMDASISSLTLETKSMRSDIAGFQSRVTGLEHHMGTLETQVATSQDRDQDLLYLRSKITDLEDRSRRDNIRLYGIPENEEGSDIQAFLGSALPKLTSLTFDLPFEFQRAHRVGPKRSDETSRPRPIIACLLRHTQTRQILQRARSHGPFRIGQYDIRITADYSKDTNERRKAFLALRPRLRQLEMKYGLFDPARMWVTKTGYPRTSTTPKN